ncbi:hypothetical protein BDW59DRAFT_137496 [Aspergillus cavernicola]|uniref:Uncharacterized protein n=1 Tax=Aspergillus cavernicola TaxID=176166 RepID=A0ABR4J2D9_9EURO
MSNGVGRRRQRSFRRMGRRRKPRLVGVLLSRSLDVLLPYHWLDALRRRWGRRWDPLRRRVRLGTRCGLIRLFLRVRG